MTNTKAKSNNICFLIILIALVCPLMLTPFISGNFLYVLLVAPPLSFSLLMMYEENNAATQTKYLSIALLFLIAMHSILSLFSKNPDIFQVYFMSEVCIPLIFLLIILFEEHTRRFLLESRFVFMLNITLLIIVSIIGLQWERFYKNELIIEIDGIAFLIYLISIVIELYHKSRTYTYYAMLSLIIISALCTAYKGYPLVFLFAYGRVLYPSLIIFVLIVFVFFSRITSEYSNYFSSRIKAQKESETSA